MRGIEGADFRGPTLQYEIGEAGPGGCVEALPVVLGAKDAGRGKTGEFLARLVPDNDLAITIKNEHRQ